MDLNYVLRKINTDRDSFLRGRLLIPSGSSKPQFWHIAMPLDGSRPLHHSRRKRHRAGTPGAGGQADENWLKSDIAAGMLHVEGTAEVTRTWPIGRE